MTTSHTSIDFSGPSYITKVVHSLANGMQKVVTSRRHRKGRGGIIEFSIWLIGGEQEHFSSFDKIGTFDWQKINVVFEVQKPGHNTIRLQMYLKSGVGYQYQLDELKLINKPRMKKIPRALVIFLSTVLILSRCEKESDPTVTIPDDI